MSANSSKGGALPSLGAIVQIAIAVMFLAALVYFIDVAEAMQRLRQADAMLVALAVALILLQHVFTAIRWQIAAHALEHELKFSLALRAYLEANFFNLALPGTIGGDGLRMWRVIQTGVGVGPALVSVLVDRAIGLLTLAMLASYGACVLMESATAARAGLTLAVIIAAVMVGAVVGSLLARVLPQLSRWSALKPILALSEGVARVFESPVKAFGSLSVSLIGHLLTVVAFAQLGAALSRDIGFLTALAALPAMLLASIVPLSISGWGMREGAGVFILMQFGLSAPDALALSVLFGLCLTAIGLLGGLIWLFSGSNRSRASEPASPPSNVESFRSKAIQVMDLDRNETRASATVLASPRKRDILAHAQANADTRDRWIADNPGYFGDDRRFMRFLVPPGSRVLVLGCGTGDLLAKLEPAHGVGVDLSPKMVDIARRSYPHLEFIVGDAEDPALIAGLDGPFDYIVLSDTIGLYDDIEGALGLLHQLCTPDTRIVIAYYSHLWQPLVFLGDTFGLRPREPHANFISTTDFENLLALSDLEPIRMDWRQMVPYRLLGLGTFINRFVGTLPVIRRLCLRRYIVARSLKAARAEHLSASILIPCRNEKGNIEAAVTRLPRFGTHQEIVFVEGNSSDGTYEECLRVQALYKDRDIKVVKQPGRGKGDAMRAAYAAATGDVLMILDADLTVPPEMLPRFHAAIASGKADFVNGSRLIYPMENEAMRPLNFFANRAFALIFTFLLNQRFTDTLCGTKVFKRDAYDRIARGRTYFGDFDPFGDFDLIFGATKQNLKIVEVPVQYKARIYGETQISRFRDGFLLLRMVLFAWRELKAI